MDNMLYIIAGLVLILLVAGVVLRKKKAQEPSVQPHVQSGKKAATLTPTAKTTSDTSTRSHEDIDKKFDHITIAERFIDQQRHDKAIETLNRGLNEKPNDSQLLLKLLSIYATIDQPENFNKVYDVIKTQNDTQSIAQADELKALFFGEQNPIAAQAMPVEDDTNFESIDFDLPTGQFDDKQFDNNASLSDQPVVQNSNRTLVDESITNPVISNELHEASSTTDTVEDNFDLTLSDFEDDFEEPTANSSTPVTSLNTTDNEGQNTSTINDSATEDSDISDFDFNLDSSEADNNTLPETSVTPSRSDDASDEMTLDSEAFILDFDELVTDVETDTNTDETNAKDLTIDAAQNDVTQSQEEDFTLSLEDFDASNSTETVLVNKEPTLEESNDFDDFVLEDRNFEESSFEVNDLKEDALEENSFENRPLTDNVLENNSFEDNNLEELRFDDSSLESTTTETPSVAATAPLLFDDNTSLENDFDSETDSSITPTSLAPVENESAVTSEVETESEEDFSSRFSADFDFVKSLDSNQVTLDLASQYIQLGEYDSAKRLLKEVMVHGNDEQQQQAKMLLERTA